MAEVRNEYPFQISYEDSRLPGSLICLRAETAEELGRQYVELLAVLDPILGAPETPPEAPQAEASTAPAKRAPTRPIPKLPPEALEALVAQGRALCKCDRTRAKWWDNRQTKTKESQPDFKCTECGYGVWLKPFKAEEE